jgi:plasmid stabilization system protein ParE
VSRRVQIRWAPFARDELRDDHAWLRERSPDAAKAFAARIRAAVATLAQHPEMGPLTRDTVPPGRYRHLISGWHRIIYRIDGRVVWIVRVFDSRRDPEDLKIVER